MGRKKRGFIKIRIILFVIILRVNRNKIKRKIFRLKNNSFFLKLKVFKTFLSKVLKTISILISGESRRGVRF